MTFPIKIICAFVLEVLQGAVGSPSYCRICGVIELLQNSLSREILLQSHGAITKFVENHYKICRSCRVTKLSQELQSHETIIGVVQPLQIDSILDVSGEVMFIRGGRHWIHEYIVTMSTRISQLSSFHRVLTYNHSVLVGIQLVVKWSTSRRDPQARVDIVVPLVYPQVIV